MSAGLFVGLELVPCVPLSRPLSRVVSTVVSGVSGVPSSPSDTTKVPHQPARACSHPFWVSLARVTKTCPRHSFLPDKPTFPEGSLCCCVHDDSDVAGRIDRASSTRATSIGVGRRHPQRREQPRHGSVRRSDMKSRSKKRAGGSRPGGAVDQADKLCPMDTLHSAERGNQAWVSRLGERSSRDASQGVVGSRMVHG